LTIFSGIHAKKVVQISKEDLARLAKECETFEREKLLAHKNQMEKQPFPSPQNPQSSLLSHSSTSFRPQLISTPNVSSVQAANNKPLGQGQQQQQRQQQLRFQFKKPQHQSQTKPHMPSRPSLAAGTAGTSPSGSTTVTKASHPTVSASPVPSWSASRPSVPTKRAAAVDAVYSISVTAATAATAGCVQEPDGVYERSRPLTTVARKLQQFSASPAKSEEAEEAAAFHPPSASTEDLLDGVDEESLFSDF